MRRSLGRECGCGVAVAMLADNDWKVHPPGDI